MTPEEKKAYRNQLILQYKESEPHFKFDDFLLDKLIEKDLQLAKMRTHHEEVKQTLQDFNLKMNTYRD